MQRLDMFRIPRLHDAMHGGAGRAVSLSPRERAGVRGNETSELPSSTFLIMVHGRYPICFTRVHLACLFTQFESFPLQSLMQRVNMFRVARFDDARGELKRMYVVPEARGRGLGRRILVELEAEARRLGYRALVLETGDRQPEAVGLYESSGYERIPCYPPYDSRALSLCFEKRLPPLE